MKRKAQGNHLPRKQAKLSNNNNPISKNINAKNNQPSVSQC